MGWKNIKEHYRIGHTVCVTDKGICIGSPYIHDLIVISLDGMIVKPMEDYTTSNEDLARYMAEMKADPEKLRQLAQSPDKFSKSITVYTYDGGNIVEKRCEETGWPNVTHDGELMYENTFSIDKAKIVKRAKEEADACLEFWPRRVEERRKELAEAEAGFAKARADRDKLEADYPTT